MRKIAFFEDRLGACPLGQSACSGLHIIIPAYDDRTRPQEMSDEEFYTFAVAETFAKAPSPKGLMPTVYEMAQSDSPNDKTFRNAWECPGGVLGVNMPKARVIHMGRIRKVRDLELEKESGSRFRQPPEIEGLFSSTRQVRLQALRDIPQTFDLDRFTTPEALKAAWPTELPARA